MKLQFLGANGQVTGSRSYLQVGKARILIDCGMFQERRYLDLNWEKSPVPPKKIDAVLLTHAHLDHCGLLPRLVEEGFRGTIYATAATVDLAEIVLEDSAEIQVEDAAYKRKRHRREGRRGKHPEIPLYTPQAARRAMRRFEPVRYGRPVQLPGGVKVVFHDAGHILGSAMIEVVAPAEDGPRRIVFSGDVGQWGKPIIRDPSTFAEADYVIMESTYGDRDHPDGGSAEEQLGRVIRETFSRGGNVVIPAFAIERTQELLYHLHEVSHNGLPERMPVFVDSPMAIDTTEVFRRHPDFYDAEAAELLADGHSPLGFDGVTMARTREQSKAINGFDRPAVIMATSGMCTAGRIKHHLAHNIGRPESTILFAGFQAPGTLGRQILDGSPQVRIHGRYIPVRARIEQIHGLSGHADRQGLERWLRAFQRPPRRLFLNHGEEDAAEALMLFARRELGWEASVPRFQETVELE